MCSFDDFVQDRDIKIFVSGFDAMEKGEPKEANPYTEGTKEYNLWVDGYNDAFAFWGGSCLSERGL